MNIFRRFWLAAKVKAALGGDVDAAKAILGWLLKSKWAQGHRREIGVGITVLNAALTLAAGPVGALVPALATPALHGALLALSAYFGIVGVAFKNDPAPAAV
jgi:hypothetical protein